VNVSAGNNDDARLQRKARRQETRRNALLDAARELLARGGLYGFTMSAVAEVADVSKASVYYYFDSKEDLVAALGARLFEREVRTLEAAVDEASTGVDALEALVRARLRLYRDDLDAFRILYVWTQGLSLNPERVAAQIYSDSDALNEAVVERLEHDRRSGRLRADAHPRKLANLAWISAHGLLLFHANLLATRSTSRFSLDDLTDEACSALRRAATPAG
jgi:AcrR family transcriptional regulator